MEHLPQSLDEAVKHLISNLPLKDRAEMAKMDKNELIELRLSSLGLYIRSEFGLWSENKALMRACCTYAGKNDVHGDDASMIIINELWEELRRTHLIRPIK